MITRPIKICLKKLNFLLRTPLLFSSGYQQTTSPTSFPTGFVCLLIPAFELLRIIPIYGQSPL